MPSKDSFHEKCTVRNGQRESLSQGKNILWLTASLLFTIITYTTPTGALVTRTDTSHSSVGRATKNHVLQGYVVYRQRTYGFLSCAQLCLANHVCVSFNYENIRHGMCELNRVGLDHKTEINGKALSPKSGFLFGQLVNLSEPVFPENANRTDRQFHFTNLNTSGRTGPTDTSGYVGTSLENKVNLKNGIQVWTVPMTGSYVIQAFGASGANGTFGVGSNLIWKRGGLGAKIQGNFHLLKATRLKILVGQMGMRGDNFADKPGGGGGGSFVTLFDNTPLIVAGGGGGGGTAREQFKDGDPGQTTENGTRCGGSGGMGGQLCNADTGGIDLSIMAGSGAGLHGDGGGKLGIAEIALSFVHGGIGGKCPSSNGGFGGGGFALVLGGGGGGYSGGGVLGTDKKGTAGGGGSYNNGNKQENKAGVNEGHGKVVITFT